MSELLREAAHHNYQNDTMRSSRLNEAPAQSWRFVVRMCHGMLISSPERPYHP